MYPVLTPQQQDTLCSNLSTAMEAQIYIDNADENMEVDSDDADVPAEWRQLRDDLMLRAGAEVDTGHPWSHSELDVVILREALDISPADLKTLKPDSR